MHLLNNPFSIGKVSKTHGLKGAVSVALRSDVFDTCIVENGFSMIEYEGKPVPFQVEKWNRDSYICKFSLCNCVEEAIKLVGHLILVDFKTISSQSFFPYNLIGLTLINTTTNATMGKVLEVHQAAGQIWLMLKEDKEIPFHIDFLNRVDEQLMELHLNLPPGIDDL